MHTPYCDNVLLFYTGDHYAYTLRYSIHMQPNDIKQARSFDKPLVQHQVAYLGLVENVRVRRAGFAYRQDYTQALARYKMLSPKTWPTWKGRPKDGVKEILKVSYLEVTGYFGPCNVSSLSILHSVSITPTTPNYNNNVI